MFKKRFVIIETRKNGVVIKHHLHGKAKDVKADIEAFKNISYKWEMVGKNTLLVWAE